MMGSKEAEMVTRINKDVQNLIADLNIVVADLSVLSQFIFQSEIERCTEDEYEIKLRSHM